MYNGGFFLFAGFLHLVFSVLVVVAIVWFILWLVRGGHHHGNFHRGMSRNSALDILDERYAKGEIGKEEYEMKKKDLTHRNGS